MKEEMNIAFIIYFLFSIATSSRTTGHDNVHSRHYVCALLIISNGVLEFETKSFVYYIFSQRFYACNALTPCSSYHLLFIYEYNFSFVIG